MLSHELVSSLATRVSQLKVHHPIRYFEIFVKTDFEVARNRGAKREVLAFGSYEKAEDMFTNRYHAASKLYLEQHEPELHEDVVVLNKNLKIPMFG